MCGKTQEDLLRDQRNEENLKQSHEEVDRLFDEAIKRHGEPKIIFRTNASRENRSLGEGWKWQNDNSIIDPQTKAPTKRGETLSLTIELRHPSDPNGIPNLLENILDKT